MGRSQMRRLVPLLLLVLLIAACSPHEDGTSDAPAPHRAMVADLEELHTPDGLLYPPELWNALAVSPGSEVLRNMALSALGEEIVWSRPPRELYDALAKETDQLMAASLIAEAGLDLTVDVSLIKEWVAGAARGGTGDEALDRLWRAAMVAQHAGLDVDLGEAVLGGVREMITDPSPLTQRQASDILTAAGSAPDNLPAPETWLRRLNAAGAVQDPQTLARELHSWVTLHPNPRGLNLDRTFWKPLLELVSVSDETYSYGVRAFVDAGNEEFAREIASRFDERRLVAGGGVLEPPIFAGSLGSTFRMIRFLHESPTGVGLLGDTGTDDLISTVQPITSRDLSHRMAGIATTYLLRPDTVPLKDRRAVIADARSEIGKGAGRLMSPEEIMAWISVAEHAIVLNVPLDFPGLSPTGLDALLDPGNDALYAVARLLLTLHGSGHEDDKVVGVLADHLMKSLSGRDLGEINSLLLFAGSLALLEVVGESPFTESQLTDESDRRQGQCLGGFQSFIREWREPDKVCNVEATRYANALSK